MDTLRELTHFFLKTRRLWLIPALVVIALSLILAGAFTLIGVSPLVYPFF